MTPASGLARQFRWRDAASLVALALASRLLLLAVYALRSHATWREFLSHSDAASFLRMGQVLVLGAPADQLSFYDHRAFPGWPALIAIAWRVLPEKVALLAPTLLLAATVPVLVWRLGGSRRLAAAVAVLPPVWLLASTYPMAEPLFLAAVLGAIAAAARQRWIVAGLLGGLACVTKPYGVFAALGLAWMAATSLREQRLRALSQLFFSAVVPVVVAAALNFARFGSVAPALAVYSAPLEQLNIAPETARQLGVAVGHWSWPFEALVQTPLRTVTPAWKIAYVYAHLLAALVLTVRGVLRRSPSRAPWETACAIWLVGNTAASLCAGPYWGFHAFDRYVIWAWPAAALLNRDWFTRGWIVGCAGAASFAAAAVSMCAK